MRRLAIALLANWDVQVDLAFTAREIALFYYADRELGLGSFSVYKVLPLGLG